MMKRVISVGNCSMDHGNLQALIQRHFSADVIQTHGEQDMQQQLHGGADLVLVNRKMDRDGADGLEIVRSLKATRDWSSIPVMLITNFPEYQAAAIKVGAAPGFGKNDLGSQETVEKLRPFLS